MWTVLFEQAFETWFLELSTEGEIDILPSIKVLEEYGPQLSRPHVDTLKGSKLKNLKRVACTTCRRPIPYPISV